MYVKVGSTGSHFNVCEHEKAKQARYTGGLWNRPNLHFTQKGKDVPILMCGGTTVNHIRVTSSEE